MGIRSEAHIRIVKRGTNAAVNLTGTVPGVRRPGAAFDSHTLKFEDDANITPLSGVSFDYDAIHQNSALYKFRGTDDDLMGYFLSIGKQDIIDKGYGLGNWSTFLRLFYGHGGKRSDAEYQIQKNQKLLEEALQLGMVKSEKKRVRTWYSLTGGGRDILELMGRCPVIPFDAATMIGKRRLAPVREHYRAIGEYNGRRTLIGSGYPRSEKLRYDARDEKYAEQLLFVDFTPDDASIKNPRFDRKGAGFDKLCKRLLDDLALKPLREIRPACIAVNNYDSQLYCYGENDREGMLYRMDSVREFAYFRKKYGSDCQLLIPETAIGYRDKREYVHAIVKSKGKVVGIIKLGKQTLTREQENMAVANNSRNYGAMSPLTLNHEAFSFGFWQSRKKLPI